MRRICHHVHRCHGSLEITVEILGTGAVSAVNSHLADSTCSPDDGIQLWDTGEIGDLMRKLPQNERATDLEFFQCCPLVGWLALRIG